MSFEVNRNKFRLEYQTLFGKTARTPPVSVAEIEHSTKGARYFKLLLHNILHNIKKGTLYFQSAVDYFI